VDSPVEVHLSPYKVAEIVFCNPPKEIGFEDGAVKT
jgi:hypothetical protein